MVGRYFGFLFQPHRCWVWMDQHPARTRASETIRLLDLFHSTYSLFHHRYIFQMSDCRCRSYPVQVTDFRPSHLIFFLPSHLILFLICVFIVSTPFVSFRLHSFLRLPPSGPLFRPNSAQAISIFGVGWGIIHPHRLHHHRRLHPMSQISGRPTLFFSSSLRSSFPLLFCDPRTLFALSPLPGLFCFCLASYLLSTEYQSIVTKSLRITLQNL
jgi:hypothetical protein